MRDNNFYVLFFQFGFEPRKPVTLGMAHIAMDDDNLFPHKIIVAFPGPAPRGDDVSI